MQKYIAMFVMALVAIVGSVASAADYPILVGNDVEHSAKVLESTTPGYTPGAQFYVACHENLWNPQEGDKQFLMPKVKGKYIARNMKNRRHHPVLVPRVWQKIEVAFPEKMPPKGQFVGFIDYTNLDGPGYCLGEGCVPFNKGGL